MARNLPSGKTWDDIAQNNVHGLTSAVSEFSGDTFIEKCRAAHPATVSNVISTLMTLGDYANCPITVATRTQELEDDSLVGPKLEATIEALLEAGIDL